MEKRPVLFLDSGIGGIPYCRYFHQCNPGENIVYLADRLNFPYGAWKKEELAAAIIRLMENVIKTINPKIVVIACNTATLAALAPLREHFPAFIFVGTVPAIKPASLASKTGKIGVLATELTIKEPYIKELAAQYGNSEITGIAAPELVKFVEEQLDSASPEAMKKIVHNYLNQFRAAGVDAIVLGCTHFLFLEEDFRQEAAPDITVFESVEGISRRIESLLAGAFPREEAISESSACSENRLLLTGTAVPDPSWTNWAHRLGFNLSLLEEV